MEKIITKNKLKKSIPSVKFSGHKKTVFIRASMLHKGDKTILQKFAKQNKYTVSIQ